MGRQYEEELLREGQTAPGLPPDEIVHRFFDDLPAEPGQSTRQSRRSWWVVGFAAAAAAVFLVWTALPRDSSKSKNPAFPLSGGSVIHSLNGERNGELWTRFTWAARRPLATTQHYEVVVRDAVGREVDRSGRLEQTEWVPTQEQQSGWPQPMTLCVQLVWPGDREEVCEDF